MMDHEAGGGNRFHGSAHAVVQGRDIHGDVHIHAPDRPKSPLYQVPSPTRHYTNNERQQAEISDVIAADADLGESGERAPTVVVVEGPPGGGKSATVYQWLAAHRDEFPDGQFYAPLAGGAQSGLESTALRQFLIAVGYEPDTVPENLDGRCTWFRSWSRGKRVAVVVDDAVTSAQVRALLPGPGASVVLVTSAGRLSGLRVREAARFVELDPLSDASARSLLGRIAGDGRVTAESEDVAELIRLCDGSTLALCISGALLAESPRRPVRRLVDELSREGRRLRKLLVDGELSMSAVLTIAFQRLDATARSCYLAFGQHPGRGEVGMDALVTALGHDETAGHDEDDVQDALDRLLAVRLIREAANGRYVMDQLIREHARDCGESDPTLVDDAHRIREYFGEFYRSRALAAGFAMMPNRGWLQRWWPDLVIDANELSAEDARAWLEAERTNLRALVEAEYKDGSETVCQLAVALWPLHERGKYLEDLDAVNECAAEVAEHLGAIPVQCLALIQRGFAFRHRGELDKAAEVFSASVRLAGKHGDHELEATAVESLGLVRREQSHLDQARDLLRRNLEMAREFGVPRREALARMHLGSVEGPSTALPLLDEALGSFGALSKPDAYNAAKTRLWRGTKLTELGRFDEAATELHEAEEYMAVHRWYFDAVQVRQALAVLALAVGDKDKARDQFAEALELCRVRGFLEQAERISARLTELDQS